MPGHFKVKEYMPLVFRNLRERFTIDERLYAVSCNFFSTCNMQLLVPNHVLLKPSLFKKKLFSIKWLLCMHLFLIGLCFI